MTDPAAVDTTSRAPAKASFWEDAIDIFFSPADVFRREENKSFTVRKIGANQIGVERIFPVGTPTLEKIEVVKNGTSGSRRAKLYYTREKHKREVDEIYARAKRRVRVAEEQKAMKPKAKTVKKVASKKVTSQE